MKEISIESQARTEFGKNAVGRMRRNGRIPANLIHDGQSTLISVDEREFSKLLSGGLRQSSLFDLKVNDRAERVFVKELTRNPVRGNVLHIDFYRITPGKKVMVTVPIEYSGSAKGIKTGGALEQFINKIKVKATPEELKDVLTVDITELDVGEAIYLKDINIPESWDLLLLGNPLVLKIARSRISQATEDDTTGADSDEKAEGAEAEKK